MILLEEETFQNKTKFLKKERKKEKKRKQKGRRAFGKNNKPNHKTL